VAELFNKLNSMTISKKMNYFSIISIFLCIGISAYFYQDIKSTVCNNETKNMLLQLIDRIGTKKDVGMSNVVALSNDSRIAQALKNNNKESLKKILSQLSVKYKKSTHFKNVKIHVHTKDNKSFYRNWNNKNGDDLSWRNTVVQVNKTKKDIVAFEVGKAGLTLKAVTPIFDTDGTHLGSIEFIQGLNSVAKQFDYDDNGFLLLMNKEQLSTAKFMKNPRQLQDYIVAQKFVKEDFFNDAKKLDIESLITGEKNYILTNEFFYTYDTVFDSEGKNIGIMLVGMRKAVIDDITSSSAKLIVVSLSVMTILLIILRVLFHFGIAQLLSNIIHSLKDSSISIENASRQLGENSLDLSNMSASQSASVEEITATIEQTSENIFNSFQNMKTLENLGKDVSSKANVGYEQMKKLSESMNSISENSLKINNIVNTIDEIAFQTNLLALNAAVEAARAGEHGLGFAVVSDEVRNLATRSSTESKKIHEVIENAVKEAQSGIVITEDTFKSFKEIVKKVDETMDVILENTNASNEQKEAIEQIRISMTQVDQVTQNLSSSSEEISTSANKLASEVKESNKIVTNISQMV
jgi:methyl-accepting chemotaxis protein